MNPRDPGASPPDDGAPECRTFMLVDLTAAGKTAKNGTLVIGAVSSNRILVLSGGNALGFAPDDIGVELILLLEETSGKLSGNIVSGEGTDEVFAKLCIK